MGSTLLTQTDSDMSLSPLVLSPPAYVNTHVLENKPSINPHTLWQFVLTGGEKEEEEEGGGEGGKRQKEKE